MQHTDYLAATVKAFITWYLIAVGLGALAYAVAGNHVAAPVVIYTAQVGIIYTIGRLLMLFAVRQPSSEN